MLCINCACVVDEDALQCSCGYRFAQISDEELPHWYVQYTDLIEHAYLPAPTPWQQSGKSGSFEEWTRLRIPICECISNSGTILDIGCANGFLLECLLYWTKLKGLQIVPYGIDMSAKLVELARLRLPQYRKHIFHANALDWQPPLRFDYVRTSLEYVPLDRQRAFLTRLLNDVVTENGALLIAQYRSRNDDLSKDWIDDRLRTLGFSVAYTASGVDDLGRERCRVAVLRNH